MTARHEDYVKFAALSHINADITYRCPLQCSMCKRAGLQQDKQSSEYKNIVQRLRLSTDISTESFIKLARFTPRLVLCGHISDSAHHPKFLELLEAYTSPEFETKTLSIHNAANQKSLDWYEKAFAISKRIKNVMWTFGLDGLPELNDSKIYRVGQDSEMIWKAMLLGKQMGIDVQWNFIVFRYNEDNIDRVRQLAKEHDLKLNVVLSNRRSNDPRLLPSDVYLTKSVKKYQQV